MASAQVSVFTRPPDSCLSGACSAVTVDAATTWCSAAIPSKKILAAQGPVLVRGNCFQELLLHGGKQKDRM